MPVIPRHLIPTHCSEEQLLEELRRPNRSATWLRSLASAPLSRESQAILKLLVQNPNTPAQVVLDAIRDLSLDTLTVILQQDAASPTLQAFCQAHLAMGWKRMGPAVQKCLARHAPETLWDTIWRTSSAAVLAQFLLNPALKPGPLATLIRPPLTKNQAQALGNSPFRQDKRIAYRVLTIMAASFQEPGSDLVLGLSAPWIKVLSPPERMVVAESLSYPPMERLARHWGQQLTPPA